MKRLSEIADSSVATGLLSLVLGAVLFVAPLLAAVVSLVILVCVGVAAAGKR